MNFEELKKYIFEKLENELSPDLLYHNLSHTKDVVLPAAEKLLEEENINEEDKTLVLSAAVLHDIGFLKQYDSNEEIATEMAKEILPQFDYTNKQIKKICKIILATRMPQNPQNLFEMIICDSDMSHLGREDFCHLSNIYRLELETYKEKHTDEEWNQIQIDFFTSHNYFTKSARKLWNPTKEENLKKCIQSINN